MIFFFVFAYFDNHKRLINASTCCSHPTEWCVISSVIRRNTIFQQIAWCISHSGQTFLLHFLFGLSCGLIMIFCVVRFLWTATFSLNKHLIKNYCLWTYFFAMFIWKFNILNRLSSGQGHFQCATIHFSVIHMPEWLLFSHICVRLAYHERAGLLVLIKRFVPRI